MSRRTFLSLGFASFVASGAAFGSLWADDAPEAASETATAGADGGGAGYGEEGGCRNGRTELVRPDGGFRSRPAVVVGRRRRFAVSIRVGRRKVSRGRVAGSEAASR